MSQYEVETTRMEKYEGDNDDMVASMRTVVDKTATLIIDNKYPCIISYANREGEAFTTGACNAESAKLMLMGIIDTVGSVLGGCTGETIEDPEHRSLAIIFLALNMLMKASDNPYTLASIAAGLFKETTVEILGKK